MDVRKTTELCIDVSRYTGINLVNLYTIFLKRKHMNVHRSTQIYLNIYMYIYIHMWWNIDKHRDKHVLFFVGSDLDLKNRLLGSQRFFSQQNSRFEEVLPLPERHAWKDQGAMPVLRPSRPFCFSPSFLSGANDNGKDKEQMMGMWLFSH